MNQKGTIKVNIFVFIIFLGLMIIGFYFVISKKSVLNILNENFKFNIEDQYNGIIIKKYADKVNHNSSMVEFSDGTNRGIHPYFWGKMEVGDSISKVKGDSIIQVFRNDEKILIEIAPFYRKAIEEEKERKMNK